MCATPIPSTADAIGRAGAACAPGRVADEYSDWARRALDGAGGGQANEESVQFLAEPPADLPAEVVKWRESGVSRLVCGFLPDEVAWTTSGWDDDFVWFVAHWEFLPFRFSERVAAGRAEYVVLATDSTAGVESLCEVIAQAWADAAGLKLARLDLVRCDEATAASTLARAALVVNDVQDWTTGFAIDELAARLGRTVLRLRQPGYSPLRHALLGQLLPAKEVGRDQSLRALLAEPLAVARKRLQPYSNSSWFAGGTGAKVWQALFGQAAMDAFWPGMNWKAFRGGTAAEACHWTNRVTGWAALASAMRRNIFPSDARDCAGKTVARWIVADLRGRVAGPVRELALPRWVRWSSEWIAQFNTATETVPLFRNAVVDWVGRSAALGSFGEPLLAVVRSAQNAVDSAVSKRTGWALVLAWAEDWSQVAEQAKTAGAMPPWLRGLCVEAFESRLRDCIPRARVEVAQLPFPNGDLWSGSFGAAAAFLRILAAVAAGRPGVARTAWRQELGKIGMRPRGGLVPFFRAVLPNAQAWRDWLVAAAKSECTQPEAFIPALLEVWVRENRFRYWSGTMSPQVAGGLATCRELWRAAGQTPAATGAAYWSLGARLAAWSGLATEAEAAVVAYGAREPKRESELAVLVSLGLALRRERPVARRLLETAMATETVGATFAFLHAVAAELLNDPARAARALARLQKLDSAYLETENIGDSRWVWAAVVFRHGGRRVAAERGRRLALQHHREAAGLVDGFLWGTATLAATWRELVPEVAQP